MVVYTMDQLAAEAITPLNQAYDPDRPRNDQRRPPSHPAPTDLPKQAKIDLARRSQKTNKPQNRDKKDEDKKDIEYRSDDEGEEGKEKEELAFGFETPEEAISGDLPPFGTTADNANATCQDKCQEEVLKKEQICANVIKRMEQYMENNGCPVNITLKDTTNNNCCNPCVKNCCC